MTYNVPSLTVPTYITAGEPVNSAVVNRLVQNSGGLVDRVSQISNNLTVTSGNSNVTITANQDILILCNNTTNITVTLPTASSQYKRITVKKTANNNATVTIQRSGSDTIEDPTNPLSTPTATSYVIITVDSSITLISSGNTWRFIDFYFNNRLQAKATTTTNQSLTNASWTKINFETEVFDFNNNYDGATNYNYTVPITGLYEIKSTLQVTSATSAIIAIYKNNSIIDRGNIIPKSSSLNIGLIYDDIHLLTAGDVIDTRCYSSGVGTVEPGEISKFYIGYKPF